MTTPSSLMAQTPSTQEVELLDFAHGLFQRNFYDMSAKEYQKFISMYPQNELIQEAYFGLSESHFFNKKFDQAIEVYQKYRELFPEGEKKDIVTLRLGQSYYHSANYQEAIVFLTQEGLAFSDLDFQKTLLFYLGKSNRSLKNTEEAVRYFDEALAINAGGSKDIYILLDKAELYEDKEEFDVAYELYNQVFSLAKDANIVSLALFKRGELLFTLERPEESVEVFEELLKQENVKPYFKDSLTNLFLAQFNLGQFSTLIDRYTLYKDQIKVSAEYFEILYLAAVSHYRVDKNEEALDLVDTLSSLEGREDAQIVKTQILKSQVLIRLQRFDAAQKALDPKELPNEKYKDQADYLVAEAFYGSQSYEMAYEYYNKVLLGKDSPYYLDALYGAAHAKSSLGQEKEAAELFMRYFHEGKDLKKQEESIHNAIFLFAKINDNVQVIEKANIYQEDCSNIEKCLQVLDLKAQTHTKLEQYDLAVQTHEHILTLVKDPEQVIQNQFLIAYNYQISEQLDKALSSYEKMMDKDTSSTFYYAGLKNMVSIFIEKEDNAKSAAIFERMITEFEGRDLEIQTYIWVVEYYFEENNFEKVIQILKKSLEREEYVQQDQVIYYYFGESYRELRQYEEAKKYYDLALSLEKPKNQYIAASYFGRGQNYYEQEKYEMAKGDFDQAILSSGDDDTLIIRARFFKGHVERLLGNDALAVKIYMLIAVLYQDEYYCSESLYFAGQLFEKLGQKKEAESAYKEIFEKYPESRVFQHASEHLNSLNEK